MQNLSDEILNYSDGLKHNSRQKIYRVQGAIMFGVALGLLVMRLVMGFMKISNDTVADVIFSVSMQIGILLLMPFLVYKFVLKLNFKQIMSFSNIKKTKWYNLVLAIPLAMCFFCFTLGVSGIWQSFIAMLGYTHSTSAPLPATFSPALFLLSLFLSAILPGFCEEFCNRGGFLSAIRGSFSFITTIVILGLSFGMFHQSVTQIFYTMFFGAFAAFLTLKLKSIFPAMVMHFCNNAISVINEYCYEYGWLGGGFNEVLEWTAINKPVFIFGAFFMICAVGIAITYLLIKLNTPKTSLANAIKPTPVIDNPEVVAKVIPVTATKQQPVEFVKEDLYKPSLKDNAFFIGAIVMAVLTTIFTFVFGYIV